MGSGDWVIYNDVSGTGQWQKIDNSSVLSGVGTGQTVALWEGAGSVTDSETLGNAPITVSSNVVSIGTLTSGSTGSLIVNQEGGVTPVAKFLSRTNKAIVQISDNDTTGFVSSENGYFSLGKNTGVNAANINIAIANSNVGIGVTATSDGDLTLNAPKLHVKGTDTSGAYNLVARFQSGNDADSTGAAILINHSNDRGLLIEAGRKDGDREVAYFNVISSGATVTPMLTMGKFGSDYNVGIGTTSPVAKLEVESTTTPLHLNRTGGATALIGLDIAGVNRGLIGATTTAAFVSYSTSAAPLVTVANTGGVQFNTYGAGTLVTDASGNITVSSGGGAGGPYLPLSAGSSYPLTDNLYINDVDQNNIGRYGNLRSEVGFTRSPVTGNPDQWFKVVEL